MSDRAIKCALLLIAASDAYAKSPDGDKRARRSSLDQLLKAYGVDIARALVASEYGRDFQ